MPVNTKIGDNAITFLEEHLKVSLEPWQKAHLQHVYQMLKPPTATLRRGSHAASMRYLARSFAPSTHLVTVVLMSPATRRRHAPRCDRCSPMANPPKLSIDGHAYHCRTRARKGRR